MEKWCINREIWEWAFYWMIEYIKEIKDNYKLCHVFDCKYDNDNDNKLIFLFFYFLFLIFNLIN
jgi:hypothetical protein